MADYSKNSQVTIAACATARGKAGVAVIRISGSLSWHICQQMIGCQISEPGKAQLRRIEDQCGQLIDEVLVLGFRQPASFTGEDVVEIHCHGSPIVVEILLERCFHLGAVAASPGEFSKRAFLNNKIDLTRAEAIADLIGAGSRQAARNAAQSLQGVFARHIDALVDQLTKLRIEIEACLDFPEEEVDIGDLTSWQAVVGGLQTRIEAIEEQADKGMRINNGFRLVLLGAPNSGKSSLFNALLGQERAIVTEYAGTTRDILSQQWQLGGLQLELIDTAGLRDSQDPVETIGINKAKEQAQHADQILYLYNEQEEAINPEVLQSCLAEHSSGSVTIIRTKIDRDGVSKNMSDYLFEGHQLAQIALSSKTGDGLELLRNHLQQRLVQEDQEETIFSARQRHLDALQCARVTLARALIQLTDANHLELAAQDLLEAQNALGEITGAVTADDLLGAIFSSFCIGK